MPIYEFICRNCNKKFEILSKMNADLSKINCEFCNSNDVFKVISNFATGNSNKSFDLSSSTSSSSSSCSSCSTHSCGTCGH